MHERKKKSILRVPFLVLLFLNYALLWPLLRDFLLVKKIEHLCLCEVHHCEHV